MEQADRQAVTLSITVETHSWNYTDGQPRHVQRTQEKRRPQALCSDLSQKLIRVLIRILFLSMVEIILISRSSIVTAAVLLQNFYIF